MSRVKMTINGVPALVCISNNSNINVLKPEIAMRAGLTIEKLKRPFLVSYGSGDPVRMMCEAVGVPFQTNKVIDQDDFYISPDFTIEHFDGILGGNWLAKHRGIAFGPGSTVTVIDAAGHVQELDSVPYVPNADRPHVWIIARKFEEKDPAKDLLAAGAHVGMGDPRFDIKLCNTR